MSACLIHIYIKYELKNIKKAIKKYIEVFNHDVKHSS